MRSILLLIVASLLTLTGCVQNETTESEVESTSTITIASSDVNAQAFFERAKLQQEMTGEEFLTFSPAPLSNTIAKDGLSFGPYTRGDMYLLMGVGEGRKNQNITEEDYEELYKIMNYLSQTGFRVMMNTMATVEHLRYAVESDSTSLVLWSSHGNEEGIYDYNQDKIPADIFANKSDSMYQFILSSCYGKVALRDFYEVPTDLTVIAWEDTTTSREMGRYLKSDKWSALNGKRFGEVVNGKVCQYASEQRVYIHDVESGERLSEEPFKASKDCLEALNN